MRKRLLLLSFSLGLLVADANAAAPDTDVVEILRNWEKASPPVTKLDISFKRLHFIRAFGGVERRGTGRFYFEAPDKALYEVQPAEIEPGEVSRKLNGKRKPYRLLPDRSAARIWTAERIVSLDPTEKTFRVFALANETRFVASRPQTLLPFVTGVRAADVQRDFKITCLRKTESAIYLRASPLGKKLRAAFHHADILLDAEIYAMKSLQLSHSDGVRTVYIFSDRKVGGDVSDDFSERISDLRGFQLERR